MTTEGSYRFQRIPAIRQTYFCYDNGRLIEKGKRWPLSTTSFLLWYEQDWLDLAVTTGQWRNSSSVWHNTCKHTCSIFINCCSILYTKLEFCHLTRRPSLTQAAPAAWEGTLFLREKNPQNLKHNSQCFHQST